VKNDPEAGTQFTVGAGAQLSLATGVWYSTVAPSNPAVTGTVISVGQEIVGGCVSFTVTVNEQVGPAEAAQFTVVVPTGKKEPDAGEQLIVPQDPFGVGAG